MSYCRWSSDDFHCDLYCYYSVGDFYQTHVAGNRIVGDVPPFPDYHLILDGKNEEFMQAYRKQMDFVEKAKHRPIGLPYDGQSFEDKTLEDFLERLKMLRATGYKFPDYVLEEVEDELAEEVALKGVLGIWE